jgi:hypothetical protein
VKWKLMIPKFLIVLTVSLASAQEVSTDRLSAYDFPHVQTFAIKLGASWGDSASETSAKTMIAKALEHKGWKEADESACDVLVVFHGTKQDRQLRTFYEGWQGYGWENVGAPALADSDAYDYKSGTLMVDIFDAKTRRAVFRGVAKNEIPGKPDDNGKSFDKAAKKMFKDLPASRSLKNSSK